MSKKHDFYYYSISCLEELPFIVHGFGTKFLTELKLKNYMKGKNLNFLSLKQIHSDIIRYVDVFPGEKLEGDAIVTSSPGILLIIKTADCLPVFIVSKNRRVVAAVHCGWRGIQRQLIQKVVSGLNNFYACEPDACIVAMGPSICGDCYEIGQDVYESFVRAHVSLQAFRRHPWREGKWFLDLKGAVRSQLIHAGVKNASIHSVDICTHCEENLISYRRDAHTKRRLLNFIGLS
ncbi:MAG: peptidoglycan editing factor PgeF [Acidobacteriota bacterium]|nr:peptidoglycan editing factor PgeF [Acidobacteriota bacterium]